MQQSSLVAVLVRWLVLWLLLCGVAAMTAPSASGLAQKKSDAKTQARELYELYREDTADRYSRAGSSVKEIAERRRKRLERLDVVLRDGKLVSGEDFYYAGRILVREGEPAERIALGHTLCAAAACQRTAYSLGAAIESLDRWMLALERPQQLCSVLDGEDGDGAPTPPFENRVHQSIRAEFELDPLHFDDKRPEPKGKKPKGFNSKEVQRLDTSLNGDPKDIRPVDPAAALTRMREIVGEGGLVGTRDYLAAGRVLARSSDAEDLALANALALLAASKNEPGGRELVTSSLDSLLRSVGQPEAFGSILTAASTEHAFTEWGPGLDDALRKAFGLPLIEREALGSGSESDE